MRSPRSRGPPPRRCCVAMSLRPLPSRRGTRSRHRPQACSLHEVEAAPGARPKLRPCSLCGVAAAARPKSRACSLHEVSAAPGAHPKLGLCFLQVRSRSSRQEYIGFRNSSLWEEEQVHTQSDSRERFQRPLEQEMVRKYIYQSIYDSCIAYGTCSYKLREKCAL
jgi:hypothetical protein